MQNVYFWPTLHRNKNTAYINVNLGLMSLEYWLQFENRLYLRSLSLSHLSVCNTSPKLDNHLVSAVNSDISDTSWPKYDGKHFDLLFVLLFLYIHLLDRCAVTNYNARCLAFQIHARTYIWLLLIESQNIYLFFFFKTGNTVCREWVQLLKNLQKFNWLKLVICKDPYERNRAR